MAKAVTVVAGVGEMFSSQTDATSNIRQIERAWRSLNSLKAGTGLIAAIPPSAIVRLGTMRRPTVETPVTAAPHRPLKWGNSISRRVDARRSRGCRAPGIRP
jgi:hypothetical protein